jgi:uncharacterized protein GlcG (DUF336 family)
MTLRHGLAAIACLAIVATAAPARAQMPIGYGPSITLSQARPLAAAAIAEAAKNQWTIVVAIVDTGGNLVLLERMDATQVGSVEVAIGKARTANGFKRATKVFEDAVLGGRTVVLGLPNALPIEGGLPLVLNDKIVGAIGISGATSPQDGVVAKAGVDALKP